MQRPAMIALAAATMFGGIATVGLTSQASAAPVNAGTAIALPELNGNTSQAKKVHRRGRRHWHGPRYRYYRPGWHYYGGWYYPRRWWGGYAYAPRRYYRRGSRHVRWCLNRYRSYNPRTDQFLGYDGYYHYCRSPWRY